jgi:hypothetical protein
MRRPNYRFERAERNRLKQAKKDEKLKRQHERTAQQKVDEPDEVLAPSPDEKA